MPKMAVAATVVIPTHARPDLIREAIDSVLTQTVADLELFVIGDGVPAPLIDGYLEACSVDPRIRWRSFPKAGRTGEVHRDHILREASGRVVCYLSDDDAWTTDHIAY